MVTLTVDLKDNSGYIAGKQYETTAKFSGGSSIQILYLIKYCKGNVEIEFGLGLSESHTDADHVSQSTV